MFGKSLVTLFLLTAVLTIAGNTFAQGRKTGLFIGINDYQDGISRLRSCAGDATNMQNKLVNDYGFGKSNTTLLTDGQATRQRILDELGNYEKQAVKGDLFVLYFSGHGSLFPDALSADKDETDQITPPLSGGAGRGLPTGYYDSTIVPVDARQKSSGKPWGNFILDDEINEIFARFTAKGVQVVFISDSCHSGTLARSLNANPNNSRKYISPTTIIGNTDNWGNVVSQKGRKSGENFDKLFLVIGSSLDTQFSLDQGSDRMSLFTEKFVETLDNYKRRNVAFTYNMIESEVRPLVEVQSDGSQTPRLDARFFDNSLLERPIFSLVAGSANSGSGNVAIGNGKQVRIVVKVTDRDGNPVNQAAFGVFQSKAILTAGRVRRDDAYILGRTNDRGFFDSEKISRTLALGNYQIKVVKEGYKAFIRDMNVVESKNGVTTFLFTLEKE